MTTTAPDGATMNGSNTDPSAFDLSQSNSKVAITGFTIEGYSTAINARFSTSNWSVTNSEIRNNNRGVQASPSSGSWNVNNNYIHNNSRYGVLGDGPKGDATQNYWGSPTGPKQDQCVDADCGYFLNSPTDSVTVPDPTPEVLTVANDGSEPYAAIEHAVVAVEDGKTVEVRPGEYHQSA